MSTRMQRARLSVRVMAAEVERRAREGSSVEGAEISAVGSVENERERRKKQWTILQLCEM